MRLTLHADYAMRVLMFAASKGEALATISEIVARFDISSGHVMKVVQALGCKGYLETIRGNKGGIRLARKPAQINIGAVVRDMEETLDIVGCLRRESYCCIQTCCVLKSALRDATNAFLATLDRYTLEDLARPRRALARLLEIAPKSAGASQ
jgi:Rrf2 family transcriptional regulator, nitric oxide-sensitive transcriptional repressor